MEKMVNIDIFGKLSLGSTLHTEYFHAHALSDKL